VVDARVLHRALLASIVVGLAFSAYAAFEVSRPALQDACSVNSFVSCGSVLHSGHTTFPPGTGIEDWWWGVGGFLALLLLDIPLLRTYDIRLLRGVFALSVVGLVLAAIFGYIELFVIGALCPVCLGAYFSGAGAVAASGQLLRMRGRADVEEETTAPTQPRPGAS
jgi:uncharacterized membrane protein